MFLANEPRVVIPDDRMSDVEQEIDTDTDEVPTDTEDVSEEVLVETEMVHDQPEIVAAPSVTITFAQTETATTIIDWRTEWTTHLVHKVTTPRLCKRRRWRMEKNKSFCKPSTH